MADRSQIEWTDATWNPVTGCTKVSPGCDHCYAESITERFHGKGSFELVSLHPERMEQPLRWRKPRRVFVNSMSDLFHAEVPKDYIGEIWDVMEHCPQHTFQILTKRAERMERVVRWFQVNYPPAAKPNVWLGVSVESPDYYSRIHHLQRTPAAVRFLSCEPLLKPLSKLPLDGIDWVIVGGESGPGARPMHPDWVRDIRDQCVRSGAAFFFKQWGAWHPIGPVYVDEEDADHDDLDIILDVLENEEAGRDVRWIDRNGYTMSSTEEYLPPPGAWYIARRSKKRNGRLFEGRTWDGMPEPELRLVAQ